MQMPFANFTVGQVFFAVVHDHLRPPLDFFEKAKEENEKERPILEAYMSLMQRCWSDDIPSRPKFPDIYAELGRLKTQLASLLRPQTSGGPVGAAMPATPATPSLGSGSQPQAAAGGSSSMSAAAGRPSAAEIASPFGRAASPLLGKAGESTAAPPGDPSGSVRIGSGGTMARSPSSSLLAGRPPVARASSAPLPPHVP